MEYASVARRPAARRPAVLTRDTPWWETPVAKGVGIVLGGAALQRTGLLRDKELFATTAVLCFAMLSGSVMHAGDRFGDSVTHFGDRFGDSVTHFGDGVAHLGDGVASIGASLNGVGEGVRAVGLRCASPACHRAFQAGVP